MKKAGMALLGGGTFSVVLSLVCVLLSILLLLAVFYWAADAVTERQETDPMGDQLDIAMIWCFGSLFGLVPCVAGGGLFLLGGGLLAGGLAVHLRQK
jgi:hypothetical protein